MSQTNQISLTKAVLMGMNIMVGAAILAAPSIITSASGDMGIFAWAVALVFLPVVLSIMRLTQLVQRDGGIYAYAQDALGRIPAFVGGALYYFGYTFAAAAVISFLRALLLVPFPHLFIIKNIFAFYSLALAIIATLNMVSLSVMSAIQIPAILLKFTPLLIVIALFPFATGADFVFDLSKLAALPKSQAALTMTIFGFMGFEYSLSLSRYLENREVNGPRAVVGAFLCTALLYVLFHFGLLRLMGAANLVALGATGVPAFLPISSLAFKGAIAVLIGMAIKLSYASSANGMITGNIETFYGLAKDGLLRFASFFTITNKNNRPLTSGILQFVVVFVLGTLVSNPTVLANLTNIAVLLVFLLLTIALIAVLRKQNNPSATDQIIAYSGFIASAGLSSYSFMLLGTTMSERLHSVAPLAVCVLASLLMYQPATIQTPRSN